jgi:hypothetical protein
MKMLLMLCVFVSLSAWADSESNSHQESEESVRTVREIR